MKLTHLLVFSTIIAVAFINFLARVEVNGASPILPAKSAKATMTAPDVGEHLPFRQQTAASLPLDDYISAKSRGMAPEVESHGQTLSQAVEQLFLLMDSAVSPARLAEKLDQMGLRLQTEVKGSAAAGRYLDIVAKSNVASGPSLLVSFDIASTEHLALARYGLKFQGSDGEHGAVVDMLAAKLGEGRQVNIHGGTLRRWSLGPHHLWIFRDSTHSPAISELTFEPDVEGHGEEP